MHSDSEQIFAKRLAAAAIASAIAISTGNEDI